MKDYTLYKGLYRHDLYEKLAGYANDGYRWIVMDPPESIRAFGLYPESTSSGWTTKLEDTIPSVIIDDFYPMEMRTFVTMDELLKEPVFLPGLLDNYQSEGDVVVPVEESAIEEYTNPDTNEVIDVSEPVKQGGLNMNIQDEINRINEKIEALNKDVKSLVDELEGIIENEFPEDGDKYWFINDKGEVFDIEFMDTESDRDSLEIGNIFQTEEQAEFAVEKLKVEAGLRKYSRPFEKMSNNFFMIYNADVESLEIHCSFKTNIQGAIYFSNRDELRQAAQSVGVDRIKKYIFGVE